MASGAKKDKPLAAFDYPMRIEVRKAKFRPLASVAALDLSRLRKGRHKIEIGFAEGGCCDRLVTAVIKNGMVAGIEFEGCGNSEKRADPGTLALVAAARQAIGVPTPSPWQPVSVAEFFRSAPGMGGIVISCGDWCIQICIRLEHEMYCLLCCLWPPGCTVDILGTGPLE